MSTTKKKRDPRSKPRPQHLARKTRLGFLRKWDIVLMVIGLLVMAGATFSGHVIIALVVTVFFTMHFVARRKEEKSLSGTNDEFYPIEEESKRRSIEFGAMSVLVIMWFSLILMLPIDGRELLSAFGLMNLGLSAWCLLAFACSLFPTNKFTLLLPFSAFAVGMVWTVVLAFS